jgi:hypothetical protein
VSNKDVKQDALDNLADALIEDILNTPDDELLREVEEDYGDPRALANKFDRILERAEKQVFGPARSAASPRVRSSVLDLRISEMIRWVKGIFDLGSRLSAFLSSLTPRTLSWSATAAAVVILVQAAVIIAVLVKEQGASSDHEREASAFAPGDEEIAALVAGGRQLMVAGDIPNARLVLQQAAEAGNATAALELGATYDPTMPARVGVVISEPPMKNADADITMARLWYEKAKDLGSTEAAAQLERLRSLPSPKR